jgi:hemerythrin-like domain-containing protein
LQTLAEDHRRFAHNPLDVIEHAHGLQVQLCDALERIADGLPDDVDRRLCAQVAANLQYELPLHHRDEEAGLFPLLRLRARPEDCVETVLNRLEREHDSDSEFASEIVECLESMGRGQAIANPEMVGYMLRGFFECYRRHIHWESVIVMPLARQRLCAEDIALLSETMDRNRSQAQ